MEIILRSAKIIDAGSGYHNQVKDILISNGVISKIAANIKAPAKAKEIKAQNLHVSLGWVDMNATFGDPGFEQRETIETGCHAAAAGGFTHVCVMPNTNPVVQTKTQVEYLIKKSENLMVQVHPVGALSENTAGKELAEMYDMFSAGAIAFGDGANTNLNAGIIERALLYAKAFGGLIICQAEEKSISKNGVMNEGELSTRMGLPGIPALAEELATVRNIYLLDYTQSKLHMQNMSLKKSVDLLRAAKKKGLNITASVNAFNLLLTEKIVEGYNTAAKLNPPLRSIDDVSALQKAVADGSIDVIVSAHQPHDEEGKKLEFDKAEFGAIGLETCYSAANTALIGKADTAVIVAALSNNPRKILGLETKVKEGAAADLTLFNPYMEWVFNETHIRSKSKNTPLLGMRFTGKVLGVIKNDRSQLYF